VVRTADPESGRSLTRPGGAFARKAAIPALLCAGGIKPALLFGKPIDQPIEEQPHLGA
jgi:hypothetical protein